MTEEIIIDGVDVAGCEYLCTNQMGNNCLNHNRGFSMNCKNISDCYYKQLQREKQYCKSLENWRETAIKNINEVNKTCIELKQKNKQLITDSRLKCLNCKYKYAMEYKSALEEIREKIELLNKDICNNCGWYKTDNCQPNGYVCHDLIEIKNKINEVLNNVES